MLKILKECLLHQVALISFILISDITCEIVLSSNNELRTVGKSYQIDASYRNGGDFDGIAWFYNESKPENRLATVSIGFWNTPSSDVVTDYSSRTNFSLGYDGLNRIMSLVFLQTTPEDQGIKIVISVIRGSVTTEIVSTTLNVSVCPDLVRAVRVSSFGNCEYNEYGCTSSFECSSKYAESVFNSTCGESATWSENEALICSLKTTTATTVTSTTVKTTTTTKKSETTTATTVTSTTVKTTTTTKKSGNTARALTPSYTAGTVICVIGGVLLIAVVVVSAVVKAALVTAIIVLYVIGFVLWLIGFILCFAVTDDGSGQLNGGQITGIVLGSIGVVAALAGFIWNIIKICED